MNEDTFEEIFSFKLNLMNVFISVTIGAFLLIIFTTYIIAFTPLREFIPGYSSSKLKKDATELALKSDSLTTALKQNEAYLKAVPTTINEEIIDGIKKITTYVIYSISVGGEIVFRNGFEIDINPDSSVFVQVYNKVKEIYPESIDL